MGLGAVILGHRHPHVEAAIKRQMKHGITFSLTHTLEVNVAEMLCDRIPSAEMVRFGKNGNDVTSAAVRLARYVSGKDHILYCGYHGWQDWYICQTSMAGGILNDIKKYSHRFNYNDLEDLEKLLSKFDGKTACIIMEPLSRTSPSDGYLHAVRNMADKYNVILIFDEVLTGFRFHPGGYQAVCGVIPDMSCFAKAMGNGMPISALVGRKEIMSKSQEIFYSLTFGGETLSLAAAKATLEVIDEEDVPNVIESNGQFLLDELDKIIRDYDLINVISIQGFPCRNVMIFSDYNGIPRDDIQTYWIQELTKRSVLTAGYHIVSLAHTKQVLDKLLTHYRAVAKDLNKSLIQQTIIEKLHCPSVKKSARRI